MAGKVSINDDAALEHEADVLGEKAKQAAGVANSAIDKIKRLQSRGTNLKKELAKEPE
jgi:hypothetical protein